MSKLEKQRKQIRSTTSEEEINETNGDIAQLRRSRSVIVRPMFFMKTKTFRATVEARLPLCSREKEDLDGMSKKIFGMATVMLREWPQEDKEPPRYCFSSSKQTLEYSRRIKWENIIKMLLTMKFLQFQEYEECVKAWEEDIPSY